MDTLLAQLGVGGIFCVLVLKLVFDYLNSRKEQDNTPPDPNSDQCRADWAMVVRQVREMHEWHNRVDEDGVFVWYRCRVTERAIERISAAIEQQTIILQKLTDRIDFLVKQQERR